ncbi:lysophospholipase [Granulosicoccus sp.]|nr:lysophospholipase [Granulosicoccus sp.]
MSQTIRSITVFLVALIAVAVSFYHLEEPRHGIDTTEVNIGKTPATLYTLADADGPMVVVAHGFAGSRQIMQAYSLTLADAGYRVLAFDFEGHGRNPGPMSGDVTSIDGTTRLLVEETREVIARARELDAQQAGIALLGHSMATDVLIRAALAEEEAGKPVDTLVAISMFSEAVTATKPPSLLVINGEWEPRLREPAVAQLKLVDRNAQEGETAVSGEVVRRVVAAPHVEHVSVLYSTSALKETVTWMNGVFDRSSDTTITAIGGWILLLLAGIVLLFKPLASCLPAGTAVQETLPMRTYLLAVLLPMVITPLLALLPDFGFLPVLVADYLMLHLALFGLLQLLIVRPTFSGGVLPALAGAVLLSLWGIAAFGFALDRYAASFLPTAGRLTIIGVLSLGTVLFMLSDAVITQSGRGVLWRRLLARGALIASLIAAAFIDPDRLIFLLLILPVLLLFYAVHGLMGRWTAQRCGPWAAGIGLGVCLAWALGVSFPMFDAG